ncbi:MAG: tRNA (N6-isopentenyl adenosine(37)-C2)-methylthiotransferase MiaB [Rhodospirillaceae bacterium]
MPADQLPNLSGTPLRRKKLFIKTYGCQMNVYDSARMVDVLAPLGYEQSDTPEGADLVVLNTCHIREKAAEKLFSDLGRIRPLKTDREAGKDPMLIAVAGCVAQAEGKALVKRAPYVDIVLGPQTTHRLPELIARAHRSAGAVLDTDFPVDTKFDHLPPPRADGPTAFLSVQEGCDKFCTFCVVPYTRGAEYSRPANAVIEEARGLVREGVREITLLGQNVNAYHGEMDKGTWSLARLIRALAEIDGLDRIRYTTSHPRDMDDDLIDAHATVPALMPYLHLPVQSGSNSILSAMNRGHTRDDYYRIIERLRSERPDLALSSDFIVGFPGETDADFADTMTLIDDIQFAQAFSFKYSSRPGTPAAENGDQVPEDIKSARLTALQSLIAQQQKAFNTACIGQTLPVLLTGPGRHDGQMIGRSPYLQPIHLDAPETSQGMIVMAEIEASISNSLSASIVKSPTAFSSQSETTKVSAH